MIDCSPILPLIHAEIVDVAISAADLVMAMGGEGEDERAIAAAVRMTLVDVLADDPKRLRFLIEEFHRHTKRVIQERGG